MKSRTKRFQCALLGALVCHGIASAQCEYEILMPEYWHGAHPYDGVNLEVETDGNTIVFSCNGSSGVWHPTHQRWGVITYQRINDEWTDEQFIISPDAYLESQFGLAIDVDGDRMLISAPNQRRSGVNGVGELYLYTRTDGAWTLDTTIRMPQLLTNGYLGRQVAFHGDRIIATVGRTFHFGYQILDGVLIFEADDDGDWWPVDVIENPTDNSGHHFGSAVILDDDRLYIGAPDVPGPKDINGLIYVFEEIDDAWTLTETIQPVHPEEHGFGREITAVRGNTLATVTDMDHLTIRERQDDGTWTGTALIELACPDIEGDCGEFTHAIDMTDDTVAVCRTTDSFGGMLYVARRHDDEWSLAPPFRVVDQQVIDLHPDFYSVPASIRNFGMDVCIVHGRAEVLSARTLFMPIFPSDEVPCLVSVNINDPYGRDLNQNKICDTWDSLTGTLGPDYNLNGIEDAWEIAHGLVRDCNDNGIIDTLELDCDGDGVPDECEPDCNDNGIPDGCESVYDAHPDQALPYQAWYPFGHERHHGLALARFTVQTGAEVIQQVTVGRGKVFDSMNSTLVVYHDPYADGDPENATLVHQQPLDFNRGGYRSGLTMPLDDIVVGTPGEDFYIGFLTSPIRPGERPWAVDDKIDGDPNDGLWQFYWLGGFDAPENMNLEDLNSAFQHGRFSSLRLDISAHFGTRESCCNTADLTFDHNVDINDLLDLLASWGTCDLGCSADINGDVIVNADDLMLLLNHWGACPEGP